MRVKIGPYRDWFGPYQLADLLCFWVPDVVDEHGYKYSPDWVHFFGEYLAHGSIIPKNKVGVYPSLGDDRPKTYLYKFLLWVEKRRTPSRHLKIKIDYMDTISASDTMGMIILPMLKAYREHNTGAPQIDHMDAPKELSDDFAKWDWVLNEMIFAFDHISGENMYWETTMSSGNSDMGFVKTSDGMSQLVNGPNHTYKTDKERIKETEKRIDNGLRLFGKYFQALWR